MGRAVRAAGVVVGLAVGLTACRGEHEGPGTIEGGRLPEALVAERSVRQAGDARTLAEATGAPAPRKQILFGDLHVHTTISADAFLMSLPILQGEGTHPVADACDFARYCSALDFWSINDHAESITPRRWRETKESIRQCNAIAGDAENPDVVAFLGWEWTHVGGTPKDHYGHKNVILRDLAEDAVPRRPIDSDSFATRAMRAAAPLRQRVLLPLFDYPNRERYFALQEFLNETRAVPRCPAGVDTRELPDDCMEGAGTPQILFQKLRQWGHAAMVIPHGTTWGLYTPAGSTWDKQLTADQHDPALQRLIEVFSGHGNSEEYRDWRGVELEPNGEKVCPEPTPEYEPCCWRAGEIIRSRCPDPGSAECQARVEKTRRLYLQADTAGRHTVPGTSVADWKGCGQCHDCFLPSYQYRPGSSVQYILGITNFDDPGDPRRFHFGFMASSDSHTARPGTGYKEYGRLYNTEGRGSRDATWSRRFNAGIATRPDPEPVAFDQDTTDLAPYLILDFERQASFFMTGGLAAVHAGGRSRQGVWDALQRREVYGTSGPRILLWFDLLNGPEGELPMGSQARLGEMPRFRVRAVGSFKQIPGCPDVSEQGLSPERLERLCRGECYHPSDERHPIDRIEVVRIRPQVGAGEPVGALVEDTWRRFACVPDPTGCTVEFDDPDFVAAGRPATYYVRAVQAPSPVVNADPLRCRFDPAGNCVEVSPCYGDYRTPFEDDCLAPAEERAWSSPIYVAPGGAS